MTPKQEILEARVVFPFEPGRSGDWVQALDRERLYGPFLRLKVVEACGRLDVPAAEELLGKCQYYEELRSGGFSPEHPPKYALTDDIAMDALGRFSQLDPDKALSFLLRCRDLREKPELLAAALAPFIPGHMDRVMEVLREDRGRGAGAAWCLLKDPVVSDQPDVVLQLMEAFQNSGEAWGQCLLKVQRKNPDLALRTLAGMILDEGRWSSVRVWDAVQCLFDGDMGRFVEWAKGQQGSDAGKFRRFAILNLAFSGGERKRVMAELAAGMFGEEVSGEFSEEEWGDLAEGIAEKLGQSTSPESERWVAQLPEAALKERALGGLAKSRLEALQEGVKEPVKEELSPGYWLKRMAPSPERDEMILKLLETLRGLNRVSPRELVGMISDPLKRERVMEGMKEGVAPAGH